MRFVAFQRFCETLGEWLVDFVETEGPVPGVPEDYSKHSDTDSARIWSHHAVFSNPDVTPDFAARLLKELQGVESCTDVRQLLDTQREFSNVTILTEGSWKSDLVELVKCLRERVKVT